MSLMTIAVMSTAQAEFSWTQSRHGYNGLKKEILQYQKLWCHGLYFLGYLYSEERVVRDGNLVTSRGPGTAFEFGIELVRAVRGDDGEADKLAGPMLLKWFHTCQIMDRCFPRDGIIPKQLSWGVLWKHRWLKLCFIPHCTFNFRLSALLLSARNSFWVILWKISGRESEKVSCGELCEFKHVTIN